MRIKQTKKDLFVCSCHNTEHQMVVIYDEDEIEGVKYPMLYIHTHLVKRPFWQRVGYGLKYIFGHQSRYGAFDEMEELIVGSLYPLDKYIIKIILYKTDSEIESLLQEKNIPYKIIKL